MYSKAVNKAASPPDKNRILFLMIICMVLSYLPWYNFSAVLSFISEEFSLSGSNTGTILAAFQVGYVLVVLFTGRLADLVGTKKVVFWATLLTGISSTAFIFLAGGFYSILTLRLLTGLSAGAIYAPGMALLSNWFGPQQRGKAIGAYTAAVTLAYGGGYFIAAPLAAAHGWRVGMLWTSLPVFVAVIILWLFVREKPETSGGENLSPVKGASTIQEPAAKSFVKPAPEGGYSGPAVITASYMGHMWELYAFWGWIGPFMVASVFAAGYSETAAVVMGGRLAAFIILLGAPAVWIMGIVADRWGRTRTIIVAATCSLAAQFVFGFLYGRSLALVVLVGLWIGFWVVSDSGIFKAGLTEMVAPNIRATSLGVQSAVGYSMTVFAPWVFGRVLDSLNNGVNPIYAEKWGLPFMILGIGAVLAPAGALILRRLPQAKLMANGRK
jgi:MFS family permease